MKEKDISVKIFIDEDPMSPREFATDTKIIIRHRKYKLFDIGAEEAFCKITGNDRLDLDLDKMLLLAKTNGLSYLPIYMYDHSGITVKAVPFLSIFDSGLVGIIFSTNPDISSEMLENELKVFDEYINGNVYGFEILLNGENISGCSGYFGSDFETNGMIFAINEDIEQFNLVVDYIDNYNVVFLKKGKLTVKDQINDFIFGEIEKWHKENKITADIDKSALICRAYVTDVGNSCIKVNVHPDEAVENETNIVVYAFDKTLKVGDYCFVGYASYPEGWKQPVAIHSTKFV